MACKKCGEALPKDIGATYLKRSLCRTCYNEFRTVSMEEEPVCRICSEPLTSDNIYPNQGRVCRTCYLHHNNETRKRKRKAGTDESEPSDVSFEITETYTPQKKDDLYIFQNSRISDEKKIGRSHDPEARAKQLSQCQNFRIQILKTYHGQGYLEATIHKRLKARKVTEGDGQEWFKIDLTTLDMVIQGAVAESQLC